MWASRGYRALREEGGAPKPDLEDACNYEVGHIQGAGGVVTFIALFAAAWAAAVEARSSTIKSL